MQSIHAIHLQGTHPQGPIHKLPNFDKKRHSLPTECNEYTLAFLGRLIEEELTATVETHFKRLRESLNYKRKDISATYQTPHALIQTKDFDYELHYELDPASPTTYRQQQKLSHLNNIDLLDVEAFNTQFMATFDAIVIELNATLSIEGIIDAFEDDTSAVWAVDYPSDYSFCKLGMAAHDAYLDFSNQHLTIQFAKKQSPQEIHQNYQALRHQFAPIEALAFLQE